MIYSYFGPTEQEITLVEDTNDVFEPSSTPTTWNTRKTVTFKKIDKIVKSLDKETNCGLKKVLTM